MPGSKGRTQRQRLIAAVDSCHRRGPDARPSLAAQGKEILRPSQQNALQTTVLRIRAADPPSRGRRWPTTCRLSIAGWPSLASYGPAESSFGQRQLSGRQESEGERERERDARLVLCNGSVHSREHPSHCLATALRHACNSVADSRNPSARKRCACLVLSDSPLQLICSAADGRPLKALVPVFWG